MGERSGWYVEGGMQAFENSLSRGMRKLFIPKKRDKWVLYAGNECESLRYVCEQVAEDQEEGRGNEKDSRAKLKMRICLRRVIV